MDKLKNLIAFWIFQIAVFKLIYYGCVLRVTLPSCFNTKHGSVGDCVGPEEPIGPFFFFRMTSSNQIGSAQSCQHKRRRQSATGSRGHGESAADVVMGRASHPIRVLYLTKCRWGCVFLYGLLTIDGKARVFGVNAWWQRCKGLLFVQKFNRPSRLCCL